MSKNNQVKVPPPRPLTNSETTHTLAQWRINFRQYCKKDDSYKYFLKSTTVWDASKSNYGFTSAINGRDVAALSDDLEDFLHMLASFLPHGYITEKIVSKSTSFSSAFHIIEENSGLVPSQESFCDFVYIVREPNEPYRQFYDRMVAFMSKHLMPGTSSEVNIDSVTVPQTGDALTVSLLNLIALVWLQKIHPDLLKIVRTEYAKELRDNTAMAALVPRISLSIDAMLVKYDKVAAINMVSNEVH